MAKTRQAVMKEIHQELLSGHGPELGQAVYDITEHAIKRHADLNCDYIAEVIKGYAASADKQAHPNDYLLALFVTLAGVGLIGFAIWMTSSPWALLALLIIPRISIIKDGKAEVNTNINKEK